MPGWANKAIMEKVAKIPTEVHLASEFAYIFIISENHSYFLNSSGIDSR